MSTETLLIVALIAGGGYWLMQEQRRAAAMQAAQLAALQRGSQDRGGFLGQIGSGVDGLLGAFGVDSGDWFQSDGGGGGGALKNTLS